MRHTVQNREYRVFRDKARLGVAMRDKTYSAVKTETACKEHLTKRYDNDRELKVNGSLPSISNPHNIRYINLG
jgi:hypothetical protein